MLKKKLVYKCFGLGLIVFLFLVKNSYAGWNDNPKKIIINTSAITSTTNIQLDRKDTNLDITFKGKNSTVGMDDQNSAKSLCIADGISDDYTEIKCHTDTLSVITIDSYNGVAYYLLNKVGTDEMQPRRTLTLTCKAGWQPLDHVTLGYKCNVDGSKNFIFGRFGISKA